MYAILTNLFKEVYICKPITSRPPNSETYIIGKGFIGADDPLAKKIITILTQRIEQEDQNILLPFYGKDVLLQKENIQHNTCEKENTMFPRNSLPVFGQMYTKL